MHALLIGCRELLKLGGLVAIIEGGSFLAIQWGSRKTLCPWRLANWVEEVQDISFQLEGSFHHILREVNERLMVSLRRECLLILFLLMSNDV